MLIMLMIGCERFNDLEMIQQLQRIPRILRKDQVGFFKHVERPEADILQVADG